MQPDVGAGHRRARSVVTGVALVLLTTVVVLALRASGSERELPPAPTGEVLVPDHVTADGAVPVGSADAPVAVTVYLDYLCPACGAFEAANGEELNGLVEEGVVRLELRPVAFLDDLSDGTRYSTRAANALATVADAVPDLVWEFHDALYDDQPAEGGPGLTDEQIAGIAESVGVPADVADGFGQGRFERWVARVTAQAFDAGLQGTPTILVDGKQFTGDPYTAGPLSDAIRQAVGDG